MVEYAYVSVLGNRSTATFAAKSTARACVTSRTSPTAWLFRADAMYGFRASDDDLSGARMELRYKF